MMTQDSLRFYKSHAVYPNFGGVVLDREEGRKIAECLGDGKAAILQNHGLITVSKHSRNVSHPWYLADNRRSEKPLMPPHSGSSLSIKHVRPVLPGILTWPSAVSHSNASPGHAQLLVDAAASGSGHKRTLIPEDEARFSYQQVGTPEKGW